MIVEDVEAPPLPDGIRLRPATAGDLPACAEIWREAINDYMGRLNQPAIPSEHGSVARLHAHLHATDPDRFWVADRPAADATPVAFAAATRRDEVWFLSMLFVRPAEQGSGIGRALLHTVLPRDDAARATGTDSAQPISNGLYAAHGIVPRMPLLNLIGRPHADAGFGALPGGMSAVPFETLASAPDGHRELVAVVDELDREIAGFAHREDHRFLRQEGRLGFLYRSRDGSVMGYAYGAPSGRIGPVAVRDADLLDPVLGHLLSAVEPRNGSSVWVPGQADAAIMPLLRAGFRLAGFPVLLCWSRPFADFTRYLPASPGLL